MPTVKELIQELQRVPQGLPVKVLLCMPGQRTGVVCNIMLIDEAVYKEPCPDCEHLAGCGAPCHNCLVEWDKIHDKGAHQNLIRIHAIAG